MLLLGRQSVSSCGLQRALLHHSYTVHPLSITGFLQRYLFGETTGVRLWKFRLKPCGPHGWRTGGRAASPTRRRSEISTRRPAPLGKAGGPRTCSEGGDLPRSAGNCVGWGWRRPSDLQSRQRGTVTGMGRSGLRWAPEQCVCGPENLRCPEPFGPRYQRLHIP